MAFQYGKISNSLLLASIIGILFSIIYLPKISITWAFAIGILSFIIFIAAMITIGKSK